jgi:Transposase domain (DUF772)
METTDNHLLKLLEKVGEIYAPTTTPKLGRPYDFIELVMLKVFLLMVLKKIKQFAALYRYLEAHPEARAACGLERMPDESTIRKRLKKLPSTLKLQVRAWGKEVIEQTATRPEVVAVDKKMIRAQGPLWHQSDRVKGQIPQGLRGVDCDSSWSVSAYRGWVQGYGLHVAVNATAGGAIIPIWAEVATNSKADAKVAAELKENLPSHEIQQSNLILIRVPLAFVAVALLQAGSYAGATDYKSRRISEWKPWLWIRLAADPILSAAFGAEIGKLRLN